MFKNFTLIFALCLATFVLLLSRFDFLPRSALYNLSIFVPIILILAGIEFVWGRKFFWRLSILILLLIFSVPFLFCFNLIHQDILGYQTKKIESPLGNLVEAKIKIGSNSLKGSIRLLENDPVHQSLGEIKSVSLISSPEVIATEQNNDGFLDISAKNKMVLPAGFTDLNLSLSKLVPTSIEIKSDLSNLNMDLSNLNLKELKTYGEFSVQKIKLPKEGRVFFKIDSIGSYLDLEIPQEQEALIKVSSPGTIILANKERFQKSNKFLITKSYQTSPNKVDIEITQGFGILKLK